MKSRLHKEAFAMNQIFFSSTFIVTTFTEKGVKKYQLDIYYIMHHTFSSKQPLETQFHYKRSVLLEHTFIIQNGVYLWRKSVSKTSHHNILYLPSFSDLQRKIPQQETLNPIVGNF